MKKAPWGSCKHLFIKGLIMRKNIYKHFSLFGIGFKNGELNTFSIVFVRKTIPDYYYRVSDIAITTTVKSKRNNTASI